jgi:hypothetical protein
MKTSLIPFFNRTTALAEIIKGDKLDQLKIFLSEKCAKKEYGSAPYSRLAVHDTGSYNQ